MTATVADVDPRDVRYVVGPVLIGVVLNALIFGSCLVQFYEYWCSKTEDRWWIKWLVRWVGFLDTFHTATSVYLLWLYTVDKIVKPGDLMHAPWPYSQTPIITVFTAYPIQLFLSYRIRLLTNSWSTFGALAFLATVQLIAGAVSGVLSTLHPNILEWDRFIPCVDLWLSAAVVCDVSITILLFRYLQLRKSGFTHTDHVIHLMMRSAIETAALGALFCVCNLMSFSIFRGTNVHFIFSLPTGRLYTNTLLTTLNSRSWFKTELARGTSSQTELPAGGMPARDSALHNDKHLWTFQSSRLSSNKLRSRNTCSLAVSIPTVSTDDGHRDEDALNAWAARGAYPHTRQRSRADVGHVTFRRMDMSKEDVAELPRALMR